MYDHILIIQIVYNQMELTNYPLHFVKVNIKSRTNSLRTGYTNSLY